MRVLRRALSAVRQRRVLAVAILLAVVVVPGAGFGLAWATAPAPNLSNGPVAEVERNGLVLTVRAGPGPYFLSELLPVTVSLSNYSGATVTVPGPIGAQVGFTGGCGSAVSATLSGGHAPTFEVPSPGVMSCPGFFGGSHLATGQTTSASDVMPLTASDEMTLTADAVTEMVATVHSQGQTYTQETSTDPFDGHWPTIRLAVRSAVPAGRTITIRRFGTRVYILAPPSAWLHLYYLYSASRRTSSDTCVTSSFGWEAIRTLWVDYLPWCGGYGAWTYAVGAAGYAIVQGSVAQK
jgi:hypothetical protein